MTPPSAPVFLGRVQVERLVTCDKFAVSHLFLIAKCNELGEGRLRSGYPDVSKREILYRKGPLNYWRRRSQQKEKT